MQHDAVAWETSVMLPGATSVPNSTSSCSTQLGRFFWTRLFFSHLEILDEHRDLIAFVRSPEGL